MNIAVRIAIVLAIGVVPLQHSLCRPPRTDGDKNLRKVATNDHYRPFLINNVFNYYGNNGGGSYNKFSNRLEGFEFPRGSELHITYEDGIIWGGFHGGRSIPKAGGSDYRHALQAGKVLIGGTATTAPVADNPSVANYRVYRVRPDVKPSTPFDASMKARLDSEEVVYISRYEPTTAADIYNQYAKDWNEWPAANGAPFKDVNGNGIYDPSVDVPGVPGADQTLWFVANDLDSARVNSFAGCPPIGLEMQKTIWGYRRPGVLGNVIFARTRITNRSGSRIDSMFIAQWADMDIGEASNDDVACDTLRDLGYAYNGSSGDGDYDFAVPASGFVLLEGPIVPGLPGDTAVFGTNSRAGYKNLRMTSFNFATNGIVAYIDPPSGAGGDIARYRMLNGLSWKGEARVNPLTDETSKFPFSGDPVTNTGWNETQSSIPPTDIRLMMSMGPLTMADGDTQEVVVAHLAARGSDRFVSIALLRNYADIVRSMFADHMRITPPDVQVTIQFPPGTGAKVSVVADARGSGVGSISALLKSKDGTTISQLQLFDDGAHGDGAPNDGVYANSGSVSRQRMPMVLTAVVTDLQNQSHTWENIVQGITTAGPLKVGSPMIFSDNFNSDGRANPDENLRYGFTIRNATGFDLANLTVGAGGSARQIAAIPAGAVDSMVYNPGDPLSYMSTDVPYGYPVNSVFQIPLSMYDDNGNHWTDSLNFAVYPLAFSPTYTSLNRLSGAASGSFYVLIVDPLQFRRDVYHIVGVDSINLAGDPGFTLYDSTDGRVLLLKHPLPDPGGHNIPLTDGFKIERGSIQVRYGMLGLDYRLPLHPWTTGGVTNVLSLEGFAGTIGNAHDHWFSGGVGGARQHSVLMKFAATDTNGVLLSPSDSLASFAYRYMNNASSAPARPEFAPFIKHPSAGYAYQDYTRTLPFAVYDLETTPRRRLMVGYLENNVPLGLVDGKYWPPAIAGQDNGVATGPREWFFIFDLPYMETPDPSLQVDIYANHVPMMWVGYPARPQNSQIVAGDNCTIIAMHPPGAADVWTFALSHDDYFPATYTLSQNYPNPFNPTTTIQYTLPYPSNVNITIYNILGQRTKVLVNTSQYAGEFKVVWDGTNSAGARVASGVYIYRIQATGITDPHRLWIAVKKMMVVR